MRGQLGEHVWLAKVNAPQQAKKDNRERRKKMFMKESFKNLGQEILQLVTYGHQKMHFRCDWYSMFSFASLSSRIFLDCHFYFIYFFFLYSVHRKFKAFS